MRKNSQLDPKVKNIPLGTGRLTIGQVGCVVTSYSNLGDTTPDVVNDYFIKHRVYSNGNLVIWSKMPGFVKRDSYNNNEVKKAIAKYGGCMVQVDYDGNPSTIGDHYIDYIGNHKAIDPLGGKVIKTSRYPKVKRYIVFDPAKIKEVFNKDTMNIDKDKYEELVTKATNADEIGAYFDVKVDQPRASETILKKYKKLEEDLKNCQKSNESFNRKLGELQSQDDKVKELEKDLLAEKKLSANYKKKLDLSANQLKTELAKKDLDCQKKVEDARIRMGKDWTLKEGKYNKEIEDLEKKVKLKEVVVQKEPIKPKTFKDKLLATINLWL